MLKFGIVFILVASWSLLRWTDGWKSNTRLESGRRFQPDDQSRATRQTAIGRLVDVGFMALGAAMVTNAILSGNR